jgi:prophage antirepressor-like protein
MTGSALRIVKRAHEAWFAAEQLEHVLLVPEVVTARDDIHAGCKDFLSRSRSNAGTTCRILAIGHHQVYRVFLAKSRKQFL